MAKKKSFSLGSIFSCVAVLFAIVAFCMMFVNFVKFEAVVNGTTIGDPTFYNGAKVTFGYTKKTTILGHTDSTEILKFSFMNLLPYILLLAGIVFVALSFLGKGGSLMNILAVVAFALAAVFFFLAPQFTTLATESDSIKKSLAVGAILAAVFSIISAVASALKIVMK